MTRGKAAMARAVLAAKAEVTVAGALAGAVAGGALVMLLLTGPLSRRPVQIIDAATFRTTATAHDGYLELHIKLLRPSACNSVSQSWIWRLSPADGPAARFFVPVNLNIVTLADASPLIQDIVVAHMLPASVTPGRWYLKIKYFDYCHLFAPIFGPQARNSADIPFDVPEGWRGPARPVPPT